MFTFVVMYACHVYSLSFYIVICPRPLGPGVCAELCSSDDDCELDERCCSNGCGHQCTKGLRCAVSRHKNLHLIHDTCMYIHMYIRVYYYYYTICLRKCLM